MVVTIVEKMRREKVARERAKTQEGRRTRQLEREAASPLSHITTVTVARIIAATTIKDEPSHALATGTNRWEPLPLPRANNGAAATVGSDSATMVLVLSFP
ncbi:uncharacterized protein DS421_18g627240 [Arachis hypogaea]|nr:uncharacterized protein DS421_18g627240 [Arachis hypogaea]